MGLLLRVIEGRLISSNFNTFTCNGHGMSLRMGPCGTPMLKLFVKILVCGNYIHTYICIDTFPIRCPFACM